MAPRIAIPVPHSDAEYSGRSLPQYEQAVREAGGEPVRIPLDLSPAEVMKQIERCDGVVLPGSKADVDPAKYDAERDPRSAPADSRRDTVDELLLQDAYNMRKPILGICYGLQILNVYRSGTLLQHIESGESGVNHEAGRDVPVAHKVEIEPDSMLARIVAPAAEPAAVGAGTLSPAVPRNFAGQGTRGRTVETEQILVPVNSSHHQSAASVGDGLRAVAHCTEDGVVEALEGTSKNHFVLAVQWHPERSVGNDPSARAIFSALVEAARRRHETLAGEPESV